MSASAEPARGWRSFPVRRPVGVLMVFLALIVFGVFSLRLLPLNLMPDIAYPKLTVRTEYPGAAPVEVELNVSRALEDVLGVVGGVVRIESVSRAGYSDVMLEFAWSTDMDQANQDVLEVLDAVRPALPDDVEDPLILRYDPTLDPVLTVSLRGEDAKFGGEAGLKLLRRLADRDLRRALEPLPGVAALKVKGGLEEEIEVDVDETQLRRMGLGIENLVARLEAENVNLAGGTLQDGRSRFLVRTVNEFLDIEDIGDVVVKSGAREVRLRDIATIRAGYKDREVITRIDGVEAVEVEVFKEADANIVDMAARVRELLETTTGPEMKRRYGVRVEVSSDRSRFIESSLAEVRQTAVIGGALAIGVLLLFLRDLRSTVIVAISIPVSVSMTFAPLQLAGVSLNIMSLGGLALGIGMLVDNSIVVLESIYRCREEGDEIVTATLRGTREVGGAVTASTLTSVAVFFPMVFVEGVAGQMFGDLGLAVVFSLLASLVVALFLIPMLASRGVDGHLVDAPVGSLGSAFAGLATRWASVETFQGSIGMLRAERWRWVGLPYVIVRLLVSLVAEAVAKLVALIALGVMFVVVAGGRGIARLIRPVATVLLGTLGGTGTRWAAAYPALLGWSLRHPWSVALVSTLAFGLAGIGALRLDTELIPELHQSEFTADLTFPVGMPLLATDGRVAPIEQEVRQRVPHLEHVTAILGSETDSADATTQGQHTARLRLTLDHDGVLAPDAREAAALRSLRGLLVAQPDLQVDIRRPVLFSFKAPIEVEIRGYDLGPLAEATDEVKRTLERLPGLRDVRGTIRPGSPELQIHYDRDAIARYGLELRAVAERVRDKILGQDATELNRRDRKIPIRVRLAGIEEASLPELRALVINPGGGRPLPLGAVATIEQGRGPNEIRRIDQQRVGVVTANLEGESLGTAVSAIAEALSERPLGPGIDIAITGQSAEWDRSAESLVLALSLSIFLVYVIMASQFESLVYPLIILISIPLAFVGVVAALWLLAEPMSVVVLLGIIMLVGVVVNNAIVLVDYIGTLKARGMATDDALLKAGQVRLRPIFMTSLTTVLGLMPMALGLGDGAEIRRPMAITVIAGLSVSTLLTLVVIPVLYAAFDRLRRGGPRRALASRLDEERRAVRPEQLAPESAASETGGV